MSAFVESRWLQKSCMLSATKSLELSLTFSLSLIKMRHLSRLVPRRYLRVLWDEKIGYEDGLRHPGCHGKRRRQSSDWPISFHRSVQSCVESCGALFQKNGVILDISSLVFNGLKRSSNE